MWWGVAAALLANALYSTGFVLEKRALTAMPQVTVREPVKLLRQVVGSPLWIAGSLSLAAGFAAQLAVYRTLPIAAAQGIFVSGLVLLVLLGAAARRGDHGPRAVRPRRHPRRAADGGAVAGRALRHGRRRGAVRAGPHGLPAHAGSRGGAVPVRRAARPPPAPAADHGRRVRRGGGPAVRRQLARDQGRVEPSDHRRARGRGGRPAALPVPVSPALHRRVRSGDVAGGAAALPGLADRAGVYDGDLPVHGGARHAVVRRVAARRSTAADAAPVGHGAGGRRTAEHAQARQSSAIGAPEPRTGQGVAPP